jgi:uncharacterized membrane protein
MRASNAWWASQLHEIFFIAVFVVTWFGVAAFAYKEKLSKTVSVVSGFLAACVTGALVISLLPDPEKNDRTRKDRMASNAELYDPRIPLAAREAKVRALVIGDFHGPTVLGPINYSFFKDGTWTSTTCDPFVENSNRVFSSGLSGTWTVKELRYAHTGSIYYGVMLATASHGGVSQVMSLVIDRDEGLLINNGGVGMAQTFPGHTSKCRLTT